tara:strand:- start:29897 stop:30445 length:549 start_codon:yes stop_codon:yes gene_type:complete
MLTKKGAIWVSAVLYLTLGIVAISLILGAAIPLVEKMRDRNTVIQTKNMLFTLDETIRTVANEGPGSQRELSPFTVTEGKLVINKADDKIVWNKDTTAIIQEPSTHGNRVVIKEGVISMELKETLVEEKYDMVLTLEYTNIDIDLVSSFANPFVGTYTALIKHTGTFTPLPGNKPIIAIIMT